MMEEEDEKNILLEAFEDDDDSVVRVMMLAKARGEKGAPFVRSSSFLSQLIVAKNVEEDGQAEKLCHFLPFFKCESLLNLIKYKNK